MLIFSFSDAHVQAHNRWNFQYTNDWFAYRRIDLARQNAAPESGRPAR